MNYTESLAYIHSVDWKGSRPGLSRITELLDKLGNPERSLRAVHVAGTNGKGSFCAMLESVLRAAGYRTGLFTSPYIEFFGERICLDGRMISDDELAAVTSEVRLAADTMTDAPTEFELITAIGFLYFAQKGVDVAVIECGMGGRLDSTNVFDAPVLSVITGVALDHTEYLGDTVEKIAAEKSGIIRTNTPVLFGGSYPEALPVIQNKASGLNAPLVVPSEPKNVRLSISGAQFDYSSPRGKIIGARIPLLGAYQPLNAANVVEAAFILRERGYKIPDAAIYKGLESVVWKGRFEKIADAPPTYFDGAHNPQGIEAAVGTVKSLFQNKAVIVMGTLADKDYRAMVRTVAPCAVTAHTVTPPSVRALPSERLAGVFVENGVAAVPHATVREAVAVARSDALQRGLPVVALGSLYSYSEIKNSLN